jgi:Nif-specific regulatory protein
LGREPVNALCFPDPALSRRHCEFVRADTAWVVRDLQSANGTFVNGVQISDHRLADGDRIAVGESILLYVSAPAAVRPFSDPAAGETLALTTRLGPDSQSAEPHRIAAAGAELEAGLLLRISTIIHSIRSEPELHREMLRLLLAAIPADVGAVFLVDGSELAPAATSARDGELSFPSGSEVVRAALTASEAVLIDDADASRVAAPMTVGETRLGAIALASRRPHAFRECDRQLTVAVARIAAIALVNLRQMATLQSETDRLQAALQLAHNMVGESPAIRRVYDRIAKIARSDSTVLIVGETGTGKELAARAIHLNGPRARRPFVAINCATLGEQLLESELFGHERGAFTGAVAQKKGKLEIAEGGTLFLDEIGELAPALQSKLLRVLQEREFERVGGTRPIKADIRVIAATNRLLRDEIRIGTFREDLYFRLNVVGFEMPPLRDRASDIPLLARHFLARAARKSDRRIGGIGEDAAAALVAYDWPGNVRELQNAVERAVVLGTTEAIVLEDLPDTIIEAALGRTASPSPNIHGAVLETKKRAIVEAFRKSGGNYTVTARLLGVHPNYLHRLIRTLGIKSQLEAIGA